MMEFQLSYFKNILKDDAVKVLRSVCQQIWKTQQWPQDWKRWFSFQYQRKAMPENVQITKQLRSYRVLAKLYSKSFKLGFYSTWTENFQMYKLGFKEAEEPEIKLPRFIGSWRKQENSRKISTSVSLTALKSLTVGIMTNCGKFFKRWEYQTTLPVSWETCKLVKKQQLEPDMEQLTGSKLGKEYDKAV